MMGINNIPEVIAGFERMGFANWARAIDGTHEPIACPPQGAEYINFKGYLLHYYADPCGPQKLLYGCQCGVHGKVHDARVF